MKSVRTIKLPVGTSAFAEYGERIYYQSDLDASFHIGQCVQFFFYDRINSVSSVLIGDVLSVEHNQVRTVLVLETHRQAQDLLEKIKNLDLAHQRAKKARKKRKRQI